MKAKVTKDYNEGIKIQYRMKMNQNDKGEWTTHTSQWELEEAIELNSRSFCPVILENMLTFSS